MEEGGEEPHVSLDFERAQRTGEVLGGGGGVTVAVAAAGDNRRAQALRGVQRQPRQVGQDMEGVGAGRAAAERDRAIAVALAEFVVAN